jgi:hypothetical protein
MKKYFTCLLLMTGITLSGFAQEAQKYESVVGVSPFRLWNGLRIKYERLLNPQVTYGGTLTGYFASFPGVQLAPAARFYFKGPPPKAFMLRQRLWAGFT